MQPSLRFPEILDSLALLRYDRLIESRLRYEVFHFAVTHYWLVSFPANGGRSWSHLVTSVSWGNKADSFAVSSSTSSPLSPPSHSKTCSPTASTRNFLWKPSNTLSVSHLLLSQAKAFLSLLNVHFLKSQLYSVGKHDVLLLPALPQLGHVVRKATVRMGLVIRTNAEKGKWSEGGGGGPVCQPLWRKAVTSDSEISMHKLINKTLSSFHINELLPLYTNNMNDDNWYFIDPLGETVVGQLSDNKCRR